MRILLVAPMVPQAAGPGAIPVLLHAQLLALRDRHEVTFLTAIGDEPGEADAAASLRRDGVDAHFADRRRPHGARARWRRRGSLASRWVLGGVPWRTVWFAAPAVQLEIDRLAAERTFDLVAVEDSSMAFFRFPAGVPGVLTEHEVRRPRPVDWRAGAPARWPRWAVRELDWRRFATAQLSAWGRFEGLQVFGDRDARAIRSLAPHLAARVHVNPFGLVLPPFDDGSRERTGSLLFVGNFFHEPNRDAARWLALEILPLVLARYPAAHLRIVGSGPPPEVRGLEGPHMEVLADVERVEPYLQNAAVVAAPVRSGGGMRMKVLYAMASGKPVVTTPRGAEGLAGAPGLAVSDSAEGLATAIADLLEDEPRRRELGRAGRAFAQEHHSPAAWGARLDVVYEAVRAAGAAERPGSHPLGGSLSGSGAR
jgi:polysaccharide biosynthesis protein PslH